MSAPPFNDLFMQHTCSEPDSRVGNPSLEAQGHATVSYGGIDQPRVRQSLLR